MFFVPVFILCLLAVDDDLFVPCYIPILFCSIRILFGTNSACWMNLGFGSNCLLKELPNCLLNLDQWNWLKTLLSKNELWRTHYKKKLQKVWKKKEKKKMGVWYLNADLRQLEAFFGKNRSPLVFAQTFSSKFWAFWHIVGLKQTTVAKVMTIWSLHVIFVISVLFFSMIK